MLDLNTRLKPNPECPVREIGEGLVILAPSGETTHSLEELGAFIWRELDGRKDLGAVLDSILETYEIDRETARADLLDFGQQLVDARLVTRVDD